MGIGFRVDCFHLFPKFWFDTCLNVCAEQNLNRWAGGGFRGFMAFGYGRLFGVDGDLGFMQALSSQVLHWRHRFDPLARVLRPYCPQGRTCGSTGLASCYKRAWPPSSAGDWHLRAHPWTGLLSGSKNTEPASPDPRDCMPPRSRSPWHDNGPKP